MTPHTATPFSIGQYLLTPFTHANTRGQFIASLSVRRGRGPQTHDRVYTFKPAFPCEDSALMYAQAQGRYWMINPASGA